MALFPSVRHVVPALVPLFSLPHIFVVATSHHDEDGVPTSFLRGTSDEMDINSDAEFLSSEGRVQASVLESPLSVHEASDARKKPADRKSIGSPMNGAISCFNARKWFDEQASPQKLLQSRSDYSAAGHTKTTQGDQDLILDSLFSEAPVGLGTTNHQTVEFGFPAGDDYGNTKPLVEGRHKFKRALLLDGGVHAATGEIPELHQRRSMKILVTQEQ